MVVCSGPLGWCPCGIPRSYNELMLFVGVGQRGIIVTSFTARPTQSSCFLGVLSCCAGSGVSLRGSSSCVGLRGRVGLVWAFVVFVYLPRMDRLPGVLR